MIDFVAAYANQEHTAFRYVFRFRSHQTTKWLVVKLMPCAAVYTVKLWAAPICSPRANHWRTDISFEPSEDEIGFAYDLAMAEIRSVLLACAQCEGCK